MALHQKISLKKANSNPVGFKSFSLKEATIDNRTIKCYLSAFGNKDSDKDILIKGCFAKSISDRGPDSQSNNKIAFLWQHNMKEPLGRITVLKEDDYGLYAEIELDSIELADRCLTQLQSGTLKTFSIGFQYNWEKMEYDSNQDAYICKELNLFEGSVVTLASNDKTYFIGMKSAEERQAIMQEWNEDLDFALKGISATKQFEIRQIVSNYKALAEIKPAAESKDHLKEKQAAKKKSSLSKLAELSAK